MFLKINEIVDPKYCFKKGAVLMANVITYLYHPLPSREQYKSGDSGSLPRVCLILGPMTE